MKIIGISGRKQAGKNTVANYIVGDIIHKMEMIQDFYINEEGKLAIKTRDAFGNSDYGIFDLNRKDAAFTEYAEKELWPYAKIYHFADPLKEMCVDLFNLNPKNIYGDNNEKNEKTQYFWGDMPDITRKYPDYNEQISHREFLEYFGTKIIRKIYNDAWSTFTLNKINREQPELAIIPDVRFPNEVQAIKDDGGIVIRLTRDMFHSDSQSENSLDAEVYDWSNFDLVIDNSNLTIKELCDTLNLFKKYWS